VLTALALPGISLNAAEPVNLTGTLAGLVTNHSGIPQMGAAVILYNRYERVVARALTNDEGAFRFDSLNPDLYSLRVTMASFVPALRRDITVHTGMRSFLAISLSSLLSSIELVYMAPGQSPIMSEDWKWVLRSSTATRPVLRVLPGIDISDPSRRGTQLSMFSDTRGMVRVSAGDGGSTSAAGNQPDLGTAFALATSLFGANHLQFSGNLGYGSASGSPTAGFRTSFSRGSNEDSPQLNVTMRQVVLPVRAGTAFVSGNRVDMPALRTVTVSSLNRARLTDNLDLEYGGSLESVSFLNRLNYASPFARLRWGLMEYGTLDLAFSSGAPATELLDEPEAADAELHHELLTLSMFPRVSLRGGRARVQRTQNVELGYRREFGSRTFSAGYYHESVHNAAFTMAGPAGFYSPSELLPDFGSNSSIFNAGAYERSGYQAALTQKFLEEHAATLAYGYNGALQSDRSRLMTTDPEELRNSLRRVMRHSLSLRLSGVAPGSGTRYSASYQWTDYDVLQPVHLALALRSTVEPGLNIHLRQPIPGMSGMIPGRLEATAELRNLMAEGYLPLDAGGGRRVVLIQAPRAVRGGLSFIF
jgi:hypothetical protein